MIGDLGPYPAYGKSRVPWARELPEHWTTERAKWLFARVDRPVLEGDDVVTCFRDGVVTLRKNRRLRGFTEAVKEIGYQGIRRGDLVIHAMDAFAGAVGVADSDGKGTPVYAVCKPGPDADAHYYAYAIREMARRQWILALSKGIRERSTDFRFETFGAELVPVPPLAEQASIVRFLTHADRHIRRYIRAKQKLIGLLEEEKQAIIHRAVTRGLNPDVRFKPSGAEWLGDVPEHWQVRPAKRLFHEVDERSSTGKEELLSVSHLTGVTPRSQKNITMFMAASYVGHKTCRPGDLVVNTMWAWMGALGVARQAGIVSPSYAVYRPLRHSTLRGEYADLLLRTMPYVREYVCCSTGIQSSRLRLYPEQFLRVPVLCPPVEEQEAMIEHVRRSTLEMMRTIEAANREISLLRELRARLIADVVTGKLDVREGAARLPDEADDEGGADRAGVEEESPADEDGGEGEAEETEDGE